MPSAIALTSEPACARGVLCQCRWRISHSWRGKDNYLARFSSPDLPDRDEELAGNYTEVLLQPGDMLYMPRGTPIIFLKANPLHCMPSIIRLKGFFCAWALTKSW